MPSLERTFAPPWRALVEYYGRCLADEELQAFETAAGRDYALLKGIDDSLLTRSQASMVLGSAAHRREVQRLLASHEHLTAQEPSVERGSFYYAFPVTRPLKRSAPAPVCYVEVTVSGGHDGVVELHRVGETFLNRRFLVGRIELSEPEIATLAEDVAAGELRQAIAERVAPDELQWDGMVFAAQADGMFRGVRRELRWLVDPRQRTLSRPLRIFLGLEAASAAPPAPLGLTVVPSNPAQDRVLAARRAPLLVVTGPPGTGKTQTILNLIATAVSAGETVLFVSKNNKAVDNVYDGFRRLFPGVLRFGNMVERRAGLGHAREVLDELLAQPQPEPFEEAPTQAERSRAQDLARQLAGVEEALARARAREEEVRVAEGLLRQAESALRGDPLAGWAAGLAERIDPPSSRRLAPWQLVGLRHVLLRTAGWDSAPEGAAQWLDALGLLEPLRRLRLRYWSGRLGLPEAALPTGPALEDWLDGLHRVATVLPFLIAHARLQHARLAQDAEPPRSTLEAQASQLRDERVRLDRAELDRAWRRRAVALRENAGLVGDALALEESLLAGPADRETLNQRRSSYKHLLGLYPVICSTNLALAGSCPSEPEVFDVVILDEASQSDIPSLLPALYRARTAIVVGDPRQLRHIAGLSAGEERRHRGAVSSWPWVAASYVEHSAYDRAAAAVGESAVILLDRHYRCVPEVIGLCNRHFYDGRLTVERPSLGGLPAAGFHLDDVAHGTTRYDRLGARSSAYNEAEAERVLGLVQHYRRLGWPVSDLGVVTPFLAQRVRLQQSLARASAQDPSLADLEVGTIHTFQGGQRRGMFFSSVVAPGSADSTRAWFRDNQNLVNVAVSRATDLLVIVCHRATLAGEGGILSALVDHALDVGGAERGELPPGLCPERFGLPASERQLLREWIEAPGAAAEVLNGGERALHGRIKDLLAGRGAYVGPKMRVKDVIDADRLPTATEQERAYAFTAHFDFTVVDEATDRALAVVELDGATHADDPRTQARDRMKDSLCEKAGMPMVRVRWGQWDALSAVAYVLDHRLARLSRRVDQV